MPDTEGDPLRTEICPNCGEPCEWNENLYLFICQPCRLWIRFTKNQSGGQLIDLSFGSDLGEGFQQRVTRWSERRQKRKQP